MQCVVSWSLVRLPYGWVEFPAWKVLSVLKVEWSSLPGRYCAKRIVPNGLSYIMLHAPSPVYRPPDWNPGSASAVTRATLPPKLQSAIPCHWFLNIVNQGQFASWLDGAYQACSSEAGSRKMLWSKLAFLLCSDGAEMCENTCKIFLVSTTKKSWLSLCSSFPNRWIDQ